MDDQKAPRDGPVRPTRTNIFVMATIGAGRDAAPVKIRNLSLTGALVEGADLPQRGARVKLRRAELEVEGEIVWRERDRAGLKFNSAISVERWLPAGGSRRRHDLDDRHPPKTRIGNGSVGRREAPASRSVTTAELRAAHHSLQALYQALTDDPDAKRRYAAELRNLDLAIQLLLNLAQRDAPVRVMDSRGSSHSGLNNILC